MDLNWLQRHTVVKFSQASRLLPTPSNFTSPNPPWILGHCVWAINFQISCELKNSTRQRQSSLERSVFIISLVGVHANSQFGSIELNIYLVASDNLTQQNHDSWNHLCFVFHEPLLLPSDVLYTEQPGYLGLKGYNFAPVSPPFCSVTLFSASHLLENSHTHLQNTNIGVFKSPIFLKSQANISISLALLP